MSENLVSHQIVTLVTITRYYSVNNGSPACKRPVFLCFSARSALSLICRVQFHFMPNLNLIAVLFRVVLPPAVFGSLTERPVWISYLCTLVIFPWTLNLCRPTLILSCITVDKSYDSCFNLKTIQNIPTSWWIMYLLAHITPLLPNSKGIWGRTFGPNDLDCAGSLFCLQKFTCHLPCSPDLAPCNAVEVIKHSSQMLTCTQSHSDRG